jgi:signal transduction histidine kinase
MMLDARQGGAPPDAVDQLQAEVVELRASRERLVLDADADRRRLERDLHEGVQQHLVGLAVSVQLASSLLESDPVAAKRVLKEIGHDVQLALDEAAHLAHRIYAPLLESGGFGAALRFAAVSAGIPASVDVSAASGYPSEIVHTIYFCWLDALQHSRGETPPAIAVREEAGALTFELLWGADHPEARLGSLRDRVEALGGRLRIESPSGNGMRVCGSLPLSR